jgi:hypothetical protein
MMDKNTVPFSIGLSALADMPILYSPTMLQATKCLAMAHDHCCALPSFLDYDAVGSLGNGCDAKEVGG